MNEYAVTYTLTTNSVQGWGSGTSGWIPSSGNISVGGTTGHFVKSGSTGRVMGEVTKVVCKCAMSSSSYSGKSNIECRLRLSDGSTILTSNPFSQYPNASYPFTFKWKPTDDEPFPDAALFKSWSIQFHRISGSSSNLYWRAFKDYPLTVTIYFHDVNEMVGDCKAPTIDSMSISGSKADAYLQNYSSITIKGNATIDPAYMDTVTNVYTLELVQGGQTIYKVSRSNWMGYQETVDEAAGKVRVTFDIGPISTVGQVTATLTLKDSADHEVTSTIGFTVVAYSPPYIAAYSGQPIAERYKSVQGDSGSYTNVAASDGSYVWFSFVAGYSKAGTNAVSSMTILHGTGSTPGSNADSTAKAITYNFGTGTSQSFSKNTTIYPTECSPSTEHWFSITITDTVTSTSVYCTIGKAESILNVERYGVAIGQFSSATSDNKKFECAYPGFFGAGITGGFNYTATHYTDGSYNTEALTGGVWVDGKPIWRLVYLGKRTFNTAQNHITAIGLGGKIDSLIFIQGFAKDSTGLVTPIPCAAPSVNYVLTLRIQGQTVILYYQPNGGWTGTVDFGVIVEYTRA